MSCCTYIIKYFAFFQPKARTKLPDMAYDLTLSIIHALRVHELRYELEARNVEIIEGIDRAGLIELLKTHRTIEYTERFSDKELTVEIEEIKQSYDWIEKTVSQWHGKVPAGAMRKMKYIGTHLVNRIRRLDCTMTPELTNILTQIFAVTQTFDAFDAEHTELNEDELEYSYIAYPPTPTRTNTVIEQPVNPVASALGMVNQNNQHDGGIADPPATENEFDHLLDVPGVQNRHSSIVPSTVPSTSRQVYMQPIDELDKEKPVGTNDYFAESQQYRMPIAKVAIDQPYQQLYRANPFDEPDNNAQRFALPPVTVTRTNQNYIPRNVAPQQSHANVPNNERQQAHSVQMTDNGQKTGYDFAIDAISKLMVRQNSTSILNWPYKFSGDTRNDKLTPYQFVQRIEQMAMSEAISDQELMNKLQFILVGDAYTWYQYEKYYIADFQSFKRAFLCRYGEESVGSLKMTIYGKKQAPGEFTLTYIEAMESLFRRLKPHQAIPPDEQFEIVMAGIASDIKVNALNRGICTVRGLHKYTSISFGKNHRASNYRKQVNPVSAEENVEEHLAKSTETSDNVTGTDVPTAVLEYFQTAAIEQRKKGNKGSNRKIELPKTEDLKTNEAQSSDKVKPAKYDTTNCPWLCHHQNCISQRPKMLEEFKKAQSAIVDQSPKKLLSCYKCNGFGHLFQNCPNREPVCADCHQSGFFTPKCPCRDKHTKNASELKTFANTNTAASGDVASNIFLENDGIGNQSLPFLRDEYISPNNESCVVNISAIYAPVSDGRPHCDVQVGDQLLTGLLDTGSQCTLIGYNTYDESDYLKSLQKSPSFITVTTADNTKHKPKFMLRIEYKVRRNNDFIVATINTHVADVYMNKPIFGIDFLGKFGIGLQEMSVNMLTAEPPKTRNVKVKHELSPEQQAQLDEVINLFPFCDPNKELNTTSKIEHSIELTSNKPIYVKPHQFYPPEAVAKAVAEVERMLEKQTIAKVTHSRWNLPILIVPKSNDKVRIVLDGRLLNLRTVPNKYPHANIERIFSRLSAVKYVSAIDVKDAFLQIKLAEHCREMTTFTLNGQMYRYKNMPAGLMNSSATLNILGSAMFNEVTNPNIYVYMDDFLLVSETFEEHIKDLRFMAEQFRFYELEANREKSDFAMMQLLWLGNIISSRGMEIDPSRIEAVQKLKRPESEREIRSVLGLTGWFRRYIDKYAEITLGLTNLLRKTPTKKIIWTTAAENSFNLLKKALTTAPILCPPNHKENFIIDASSSEQAISGILSQQIEGHMRVIAYMSAKLPAAQQKYSPAERNVLSVIYACDKWRMYIHDKVTTIITTTPDVAWLMRNKDVSGRLSRYGLRLQAYNLVFKNRTTKRAFVHVDVLCTIIDDSVEMLNMKALNIIEDDELDRVNRFDSNLNDMSSGDAVPHTNAVPITVRENFDLRDGFVQVYTDGSCENNGAAGAAAGIGVWFNDHHPLNISEPIRGIATNNRAEIQAVKRAIEVASANKIDKLCIYSDSQYVIKAITEWMHEWKLDDWTLKKGQKVANKTDFQELDDIINANKHMTIVFKHVRGHKDTYGNIEADLLARNAARMSQQQMNEELIASGEASDTKLNEFACEKNKVHENCMDVESDAFRESENQVEIINAVCLIDIESFKTTACEWYINIKTEVEANIRPEFKIDDELLYYKPKTNVFKTDIEWKLVVPSEYIQLVITDEHSALSAGHPGFYKTLHRLKAKYYFERMYSTVYEFIKQCEICRLCKSSNEATKVPYGQERTPKFTGQTLCMDFLGPLVVSGNQNKNKWLFVTTCKLSKFVWLKAMRAATAKNVIDFLEETIRSTFGITPEQIICDNGTQFDGKAFREYCKGLNIKLAYTPIRHPQANPAENVNKVIGNVLRAQILQLKLEHQDWDKHINNIAFALNSSIHSQTKTPPFVMMFGRPGINDGHEFKYLYKNEPVENDGEERKAKFTLIAEKVIENLHRAYLVNERNYNKRAKERVFSVNDIVYLKNFKLSDKDKHYMAKLAPKKQPYIVIEKLSGNRYVLKKLNGKRNETVVYSAIDIFTS